jgi:hypothetical protein
MDPRDPDVLYASAYQCRRRVWALIDGGPEVDEALALEARLEDLKVELLGDSVVSSRSERTPMSIESRVNRIVGAQWTSTSAPTQTNRDAYEIASEKFAEVLAKMRVLIGEDLVRLEQDLEAAGGPWTPGRLPDWQPE